MIRRHRKEQTEIAKTEQEQLQAATGDLKDIIAVLQYNADQLSERIEEIRKDRTINAGEN